MIYYIDRKTGERKQEQVYGEKSLKFLYGKRLTFAHLIARVPLFSKFYGFLQKRKSSAKKVAPFIEKFGVDVTEFAKPADTFTSFNDFFCRKLKEGSRPIVEEADRAIIPADGRYLFYPRVDECDGFVVKGRKFSLPKLLDDKALAEKYAKGSLVMGRLCPTDYHRFHFPCDGIPSSVKPISGALYSVNPIALKKHVELLTENKRMITEIESEEFGKVLYIEVGATCVGTIHQTYQPKMLYKKGDEKGYFSFGGSAVLLLFEPNRIQFDEDLIKNSSEHIETLCLMGQSLGCKTFY